MPTTDHYDVVNTPRVGTHLLERLG